MLVLYSFVCFVAVAFGKTKLLPSNCLHNKGERWIYQKSKSNSLDDVYQSLYRTHELFSNIGVKDRDPGSRIRVLGSSGMICGYSSIRILVTALSTDISLLFCIVCQSVRHQPPSACPHLFVRIITPKQLKEIE